MLARRLITVALLLIPFALAASGIFTQAFLTWDESNYARLGLPPEFRQHPLQVFSLNYQGAKPAAAVTTSIGYLIFGINPWAPVMLSLWMGALLLAVVYKWASQVGSNVFSGWLAMALLGSSFSLNWYSRWRSPQNAQMLFIAIASLCLVQWYRSGKQNRIRSAGIAVGVAILYHYLSVYAATAMGVWLLVSIPNKIGDAKIMRPFGVRLANATTFAIWSTVPICLAMALSAYRSTGVESEGTSDLRFYYAETLRWQITELGSAEEPNVLYYPRVLVYYEGVSIIVLIALVEGYYLLRRRHHQGRIGLLTILLYMPSSILVLSSVFGSDMRPRAMAIILPTAMVCVGCGLDRIWQSVVGPVRHRWWLAGLLLVGTLVTGISKGKSLFSLSSPYYGIRDYVEDNRVTVLVGWQPQGRGMRPNEWKFMQRDIPSLQRVIWVGQVEDVISACEANPSSVLFVGGGTIEPAHTGLRLAVKFDNPIDRYAPTLLEEGHNLSLSALSSRMLDVSTSGVRLYDFEHCHA